LGSKDIRGTLAPKPQPYLKRKTEAHILTIS
jgi:hypothetical protein